jgi:hypothetical protein
VATRVDRLIFVSDVELGAGPKRGQGDGVLAQLLTVVRGWRGGCIPLDPICREMATAEILAVSDGFPCVIAVTSRGYRLLADEKVIEACGANPEALEREIVRAARMSALSLR